MKISSAMPSAARASRERGFSLIELMIAILIGLFLIGGLLTLVQAMKRSSVTQSGLSQLQDSERMAMTLMTDVIQSTGYFITPLSNTAQSSFPVAAPFTTLGQSIVGTGAAGAAAPGDTITVRYMTTGADNIINCTGNTSAVGAATFVNTFSIDANGNLSCTLSVNGVAQPAVPLIAGLNSMSISYGVQTNTTVSTNSVDSYLDAPGVTAGSYWMAVKSVKITLTFVNPMHGSLPGQTMSAPAYVSFTRIVDVMSNMGVTS